MCTALSIKSNNNKCFFGRNMDLSYNFNQSVMLIPRNYKFQDKVTGDMITNNRAIIGIGTVIALSDKIIINEGSLEDYKNKINEFLEEKM